MAIVASGAIGAYNDGVRHAQAGDRAAALAAFAVAASGAPAWPQPCEARGQLLFAAGDIAAAASAFEEARARARHRARAGESGVVPAALAAMEPRRRSRPELTDPAVYARALEAAYTRALSERHLTPH